MIDFMHGKNTKQNGTPNTAKNDINNAEDFKTEKGSIDVCETINVQKTQTIIYCCCILFILLFVALILQWHNEEISIGRNISISFLTIWVFALAIFAPSDSVLFTVIFFLLAYASLVCSGEYKHIHVNVYLSIIFVNWYCYSKQQTRRKLIFATLLLTSFAVFAVIVLRVVLQQMYDTKLDFAILLLVLMNMLAVQYFLS